MGRGLKTRIVVTLGLLLSLSASSQAQDKGLRKFHWGVTSLSASQWIPWIAKEAKLYEKYGMEAELVLLRGSGQSAQAIIGGSILGAPCTLTTVMGANLSGADLVTVAHTVSGVQSKLLVRPDIRKPEDLRGKRFGIQSIGGSTWMHTILGLEHVGLDVKRDNISLLVIGDSVLISQSLEAGRIDAAVLDGALVRRLKSKGFYIVADMTPANIPMLNQAIVVTQEFLQKRADVAEKILMALVESLSYTLSPANKSVVAKTMMRRFHIDDPVIAEEGYQDLLTSIERKPLPSLEALRNIRRLMAVQNPKAASVKVEELIDARLIRRLDENGYMDKIAATYGLK